MLGQGIEAVQRLEIEPADYHKMPEPRVSCSMLKAFADDPEACHEEYIARTFRREPTDSMRWGLNFEQLVFYDRLPAVKIPQEVLRKQMREGKDVFVRAGAAWEAWRDSAILLNGPDVQMLREDEWEREIAPLLIAREKVREHEAAEKLLWGQGEAHTTYLWDDVSTGVRLPCKCQFDIIHARRLLVDLKTCHQGALASRATLARQINEYKYHWQAWWYTQAHYARTGEVFPFMFVFVGNKRPHSVQVVQLEPKWFALAEMQIGTYLMRLAECWQSGNWRPAGWGSIQRLGPPRWASQKWEEEAW